MKLYAGNVASLLRRFDKLAVNMADTLANRFGEQTVSSLLPQTRQVFEQLIPTIPDVGGRPPFTLFVNSTAMFLALYRAMQEHGYSLEETGVVIYEMTQSYIDDIPPVQKRFISQLMFSRIFLARARHRARRSQASMLPETFIYRFVEGRRAEYNYGIDYTQCAIVKFLKKHDALELAPYICKLDVIYSGAFDWGLKRTQTIASGADHCDFRFRKGNTTEVKQ